MSVDNFIPSVWSANILSTLDKALVYGSLVNRNYEGEIAGQGDTVKINQIGDITVSPYVKNSTTISYQDLDDASLMLKIDQASYFAFGVDDIDKAQANVDLMSAATAKAAYKIADSIDQFIAGLNVSAGTTSGLGSNSVPLTVTAKASAGSNISILEMFALIGEKLTAANVPTLGRWIVIPPVLQTKLVLSGLVNATNNDAILQNGQLMKAFGFDIRVSNNVPNTSGAKYKIIAGTNDAMSFASQINSVEAGRRSDRFGDTMRGLTVYGAKVVQPAALACAIVSTASEA